jgi:hypothetical protein
VIGIKMSFEFVYDASDPTIITGFTGTAPAALVIPSGVLQIGPFAFAGNTDIQSVVLPAGLISLAVGIFNGCSALTSIALPTGLQSIGSGAFSMTGLTSINLSGYTGTALAISIFSGCTSLSSVNLPATLESIGIGAFTNCSALASIALPTGLQSIGSSAFSQTGLTSINLSGYTGAALANAAFSNCTSLSSVNLPATLESIGTNAFSSCSALTSIALPTGLQSIGSAAFIQTGLTSINLSGYTWTTLADSIFSGCTSLSSVNLPATLESISSYAFGSCSALTTIALPAGLQSIGIGAFSGSGLTSIDLSSLPLTDVANLLFQGCTSLSSVMLPSTIISIGMSSFNGCTALTSLPLPPNLNSLGGSAFAGSGITAVRIPSTLTNLTLGGGLSQFANCTSLTSVVLPATLTHTGGQMFEGCTALTTITIPGSTQSFGTGDFTNSGLTAIYFAGNAPWNIDQLGIPAGATVYYVEGKTGWDAVSGMTLATWTPPSLATTVSAALTDPGTTREQLKETLANMAASFAEPVATLTGVDISKLIATTAAGSTVDFTNVDVVVVAGNATLPAAPTTGSVLYIPAGATVTADDGASYTIAFSGNSLVVNDVPIALGSPFTLGRTQYRFVATGSGAAVVEGVLPGTPIIQSTMGGDGSLTVVFTAPDAGSSPITDYVVQLDGGPTQSVGLGTPVGGDLSITLTGLTNDQSYAIGLAAVSAVGQSAYAAAGGSPTLGFPLRPDIISEPTISENGIVTITIFNINYNNGTPTDPGVRVQQNGVILDNSAVSTSVLDNQDGTLTITLIVMGASSSDKFRIALENENGIGPFSITNLAAPDAPTNVVATGGDGSISIAFTEPNPGDLQITGYSVIYNNVDYSESATITVATTIPIVLTGLTNGSEYSITVSAISEVGTGAGSDPVNATPTDGGSPPAIPDAPSNITATPGDGQITLEFAEPNSNGATITGYTYTLNGGAAETATFLVSAGIVSFVIVSLAAGTFYTITVAATTADGSGPESNSVSATTDDPPPEAPAEITATPGNGQVIFTFPTPESYGVPITGYQYSIDGGGTASNVDSFTVLAGIVSVSVSGLTNDVRYDISLITVAGDRSSSPSIPVMVVPRANPPASPTVSSVSAGTTTITLTLSGIQLNDGVLTGVLVKDADSYSLLASSDVTYTDNGSTIEVVISGLTSGVSYSFIVALDSDVGAGSYSASTEAVSLLQGNGGGGGGGGPVEPPSGGGGGSGAICFLADAPVLTPEGYRPISELRAGDKVMTAAGVAVAAVRVVAMPVVGGSETNPYVIPVGEFGATEDLPISPDHRVAVAGRGMVPAKELGLERKIMEGSFLYFNVELPEGANMIVAGVEVESLANVRRMVVPLAVFKQLIERKYGARTAAVESNILRTCRFLDGDRVEIPVMRK